MYNQNVMQTLFHHTYKCKKYTHPIFSVKLQKVDNRIEIQTDKNHIHCI